jgi:hypothetical protein
MNRLLCVLVGVLAQLSTACVSQTEIMRKGGDRGDFYAYHYGQIGGQGTAQSSMGTSVAFDGQKSLADVAQAIVARGFSMDATKVQLSKEVTERFRLGQITIQQHDALMAAIAQGETAAGLEIAIQTILHPH